MLLSNQYTLVNLDDFMTTPPPPPPKSRLLYQNKHLLRTILKALAMYRNLRRYTSLIWTSLQYGHFSSISRVCSNKFTWCFHKQNNYIFNRHANIQRTYSLVLLLFSFEIPLQIYRQLENY